MYAVHSPWEGQVGGSQATSGEMVILPNNGPSTYVQHLASLMHIWDCIMRGPMNVINSAQQASTIPCVLILPL